MKIKTSNFQLSTFNGQGGRFERSTFVSSVRAFTLLELLIAVIAFAIVLAAINGVFYSGLKLRNRSAASLEKSLPLTQALTILKRDLANLAVPSTNDAKFIGELQSTPSSSSTQQPKFGSLQGATGGASGQNGQIGPNFYTFSGILDSDTPWPSVQKVAFLLTDSTNRNALGKDLVRAVTRNLLPVNGTEEDPVEQLLLTDVADLRFLYHDGTEWQETWDSTSSTTMKLPRAIKVQIQLAAEDRASLRPPIELVVPVLTEASTNTTSSGGGQ